MTTKDIIEKMEKEFDAHYGEYGDNDFGSCSVECELRMDNIKKFIHSYTRTLLESFGEEIIGDCDDLFLEWRAYVNKAYEEKKTQAIFGFPVWLEKKQRLKMKEIIRSIGK